jgi:phosphate transport system substrate-binding protein
MRPPLGRVASRLLAALVLCYAMLGVPPGRADVSGSVTIVGNGPEMNAIEKLARAFEKANPRAYLDIVWEESSKPVELVKSGKADIAVAGKEDPDLRATPIGWDGIAVMVNMSNNTKDVTSQQVADLFSGKVKFWSDLGGPETRILIIDRPRHRNIRETFEQQLGIAGKIADSAKVIGPDDKAIKTVVGTVPPLSAVTYISLGTALEAVNSGVAVRLLPIDKVEPEEPTVKDGRYKLRRPVLLLSKKDANPLVDAFQAFALSKPGQTIIDNEAYTPLDQK